MKENQFRKYAQVLIDISKILNFKEQLGVQVSYSSNTNTLTILQYVVGWRTKTNTPLFKRADGRAWTVEYRDKIAKISMYAPTVSTESSVIKSDDLPFHINVIEQVLGIKVLGNAYIQGLYQPSKVIVSNGINTNN